MPQKRSETPQKPLKLKKTMIKTQQKKGKRTGSRIRPIPPIKPGPKNEKGGNSGTQKKSLSESQCNLSGWVKGHSRKPHQGPKPVMTASPKLRGCYRGTNQTGKKKVLEGGNVTKSLIAISKTKLGALSGGGSPAKRLLTQVRIQNCRKMGT